MDSRLDPCAAAAEGEIVVATYNVEALFDCEKDHEKEDHNYLPHGFFAWDEAKLARKLANLGRAIRAINAGRGPDVLALNEVENRGVAERLRDALGNLGYETVIHLETDCAYGLDNAVLSRFAPAGPPKLHAVGIRKARGILEVTLDVEGAPLTLLVNHWPAGTGRFAAQRLDVGRRLRDLIEDRLRAEPDVEILVLGDFNATPDEDAFGARGLRATSDPAHLAEPSRSATLLDTRPSRDGGTHFTRPYPYTGDDGQWTASTTSS